MPSMGICFNFDLFVRVFSRYLVDQLQQVIPAFDGIIPLKDELGDVSEPQPVSQLFSEETGGCGKALKNFLALLLGAHSADGNAGLYQIGRDIHPGNGNDPLDAGIINLTCE